MPTAEEIQAQKDQEEARDADLQTRIHGAAATHVKKLREGLVKEIAASFTSEIASLKEELASLKAAPAKEAEKPSAHAVDSPEFKGLQKQIAELKAENEKSRASQHAADARSRDIALRQKLGEELSKHGVDAARARHAVGYLVDANKQVRWSDDGETAVFRDADNQEIDLSTGLKSWVKSDDGKLYLPPRGASGSGDRGGGNPAGGVKPNTIQRGDLGRALLASFGGGSSGVE